MTSCASPRICFRSCVGFEPPCRESVLQNQEEEDEEEDVAAAVVFACFTSLPPLGPFLPPLAPFLGSLVGSPLTSLTSWTSWASRESRASTFSSCVSYSSSLF